MHTVTISDQIHLLGLGCGGSYTAEHIAKRGAAYVHELHGYDGDVVDQSNTKSQTYLPRHVNMKKVDALAEQVAEWGK
jgi:tRNA A37 threonylcarbamoyladenosine dehydratase